MAVSPVPTSSVAWAGVSRVQDSCLSHVKEVSIGRRGCGVSGRLPIETAAVGGSAGDFGRAAKISQVPAAF